VSEILRKHGVSRHTYFTWKRRYAGATVEDLKRMRELEAENGKLKRMCTDLALENAAIKEVLNRKP
jgi:putative transposase